MTHQTHDPRTTTAGPDEKVVLPAREARQGAEGKPVRTVLFAGIALVVIAFVVIYMVFAR